MTFPDGGFQVTAHRAFLPTFVDNLAADLHVDVCSLYRIDGDELVLEASHGLSPSALGYRIPITSGLTGRVARTGRIVATKHPERDPDFHPVTGSGEERCQTYLGVPIRDDGKVTGVLVVQTFEPHVFDLEEIARIQYTVREIEAVPQV
jgi:signal transduction protein with GAF and PtsI domain